MTKPITPNNPSSALDTLTYNIEDYPKIRILKPDEVKIKDYSYDWTVPYEPKRSYGNIKLRLGMDQSLGAIAFCKTGSEIVSFI